MVKTIDSKVGGCSLKSSEDPSCNTMYVTSVLMGENPREEHVNYTQRDVNEITDWLRETVVNFKVVSSRPMMGRPMF